MNVMKEAHRLAKVVVANSPGKGVYAYALKHALIHFHKEYKAMSKVNAVKVSDIKETCITDTSATDFVIEGTAVDSEGQQVHIGFSTGNEGAAQKEAEYYLNSDNGFKKVDMYLVMHYVNKAQKEFKITK